MHLKFLKILFFLFLFIFLFNFLPSKNFLKNFFFSILKPFQNFFLVLSEKFLVLFEKIRKINQLESENQKLKDELKEMIEKAILAENLKAENEILKKALQMKLNEEFQLQIAHFVMKSPFNDTILIDKGKKDDIKENSLVILENKILVGKVIKVYDDFSLVQLVSNEDFSMPVKILGKEIFGLVKGKSDFKMKIEKIDNKEDIKEGDIFYSILTENTPEGLILGKVKRVERSDVKPFLEIEAESFFQPKDLKFVFVIKNFKK